MFVIDAQDLDRFKKTKEEQYVGELSMDKVTIILRDDRVVAYDHACGTKYLIPHQYHFLLVRHHIPHQRYRDGL